MLCVAFAEALGTERVGIDDDFIRLGGDSLKAIRAASVCRESGTEVSVSDILSRRTPARIASLMRKTGPGAVCTVESGCPLTGGSLDVYLDIESGKSGALYIINEVYEIPSGISDDAVKYTILKMLDVHPVLCSRITVADGVPYLSPGASPEITVSEGPARDIRRPFELSQSLCRFHIVSGSRIQAAFHHTIFDGMSSDIVRRTLDRLFAGERPEKDTVYLDDASQFAAADVDAGLEYFRAMLSSIPDDCLLIDDVKGDYGSGSLDLSASFTAISERARFFGTIPANMLASAFGYMLSRFTGSSGAVFETIINGREQAGTGVGMFVRTLPIAIDCSDRSVREFIESSSDVLFGVISNQRCPFHAVAREFGLNFGIVFNYMSGMDE